MRTYWDWYNKESSHPLSQQPPTMQHPSFLLFDLGGVLIENASFDALSRLLVRALPGDAIKERWLLSPSVRRFELGQCSAPEFAAAFIAEWEIAIDPDAFLEEFLTWPKALTPQALRMIASLRETYRVGCLSNSNALHWRKFGGFAGIFDIALSSHLLGSIKPDADAFARTLQVCGAAPHDVWFFDDALTNVQTAATLGIRSFHVNGLEALQQTLHSLDLL